MLVGSRGVVLTRVPGDDRPGSVRLVLDGAVDVWLAYADTPLEPGRAVLVYGVRPGRALDVMADPVDRWAPG